MTTLVKRLPIAGGANPLALQPLSEDLGEMTNLLDWWTAGEGHLGSGWKGRKGGNLLTPASGVALPVPISGGPNGTKMISSPGLVTTTLRVPDAANLLPLDGSFSLVFVTRPVATAAGNGAVFGNASASGLYAGYSGVHPDQIMIFRGQGTVTLTTPNTGNNNAEGFRLYVYSYEWVSAASQITKIRRDGVEIATRTANDSAFKLTNRRLSLFATGATGTDLRFTGDFVEGGVYAGALGAAANAADLAAIEGYIQDRLGIF